MALLKNLLIPRSIGQRFAIAIGTGAGAILIVLAVANYVSGRELLLQQTSQEALKEVTDEMRTMDDFVERMAMLPYVIGATQIATPKENGVTVRWLDSLLEYCPIRAVYGLYMVLDGKDWHDPDADIWVDRKSWPKLAHINYDFHDATQDWYNGAKIRKGTHVTQPYFDEGGSDIDMISITRPVYNRLGNFIGVAGVDVALDEMRKIVRKIHIRSIEADLTEESGSIGAERESLIKKNLGIHESAYLISKTGAMIVSPEASQDKPASKPGDQEKQSQESLLADLINQGFVASVPGLQKILATPSGWLHLRDGSDKVIYWAEGRTTGWKLVLEVPFQLIVAPARQLAFQSALIGGSGLLILMGVVFFTARRISGPIAQLQSVATNFEKGSYGQGKEVLDLVGKRPDELGRFAKSFSAMAREISLREERLSEWNANLEQTVKDRTSDLARAMETVERANRAMASELAEAATYSRAVLPAKLTGPIITDWVFITSSQLGGDSFGYHWLDDDTLSLYLLDVCGHGVGAALLSISVVNVLRTGSLSGADFHDPSAVMANLNTSFPMELHNDMYFTAWYGVYSRSSRELRFCCGGHPPAVLIGPDGEISHLAAKGAVVGAFPRGAFETASLTVPEGSRLYLFSDGAYEIDRPASTMMTHEEFSKILGTPSVGPKLDAVVAEVRRQQGSETFADDFSLVEFRFPEKEGVPVQSPHSAPASPSLLLLKSDLPELTKLHPFLTGFCSREGLPGDLIFDLELILEELATNVMKYGGVDEGADCCRIELKRGGNGITIRFSDTGTPFNPLERDEVDTSLPVEERPIGGLGIHFIRKLTDSQHYEYRDGENILTLVKHLAPSVDYEV